MKSKNILILAVALFVAFISCQKDEYEMPNDMSAVGWYTSNFRNEQLMIGINDFMSFSDLSQNALSHKWTIPDGAFFLKGTITRNDTVLEQFIDPNGGLETTDATIHVLFTKSGLQPVRLYNTFKQKVVFMGRDTMEAVQQGDVWVIDTTFMVDVLDTIVPQILIRQDGVEIPLGTDTIYVEAGATLEFVDITTIGRPNTRQWNIAGETSSDSAATILFKKLGVFNGVFNVSRQGENIPNDYDQLKIPNPIKVIPSSKPWILIGDIVELEDETIRLPFNGEFLPFVGKESYFTVNVNGTPFTISSITINPDDKTLLEIKLAEPIYRPDHITVSVAPNNGINSTDYRSLTPFENVPVIMHNVNLLDDAVYSFEDGGSWVPVWDNVGTVEFVQITPEQGISMRITRTTGKAKFESSNAKFNLEAGDYVLTYKVYVDPASAGGSFSPWLITGDWSYSKQFWQGLNEGTDPWTFQNYGTGKWMEVTREFTLDSAKEGLFFFVQLNNDGQIISFDDFHLVKKEVRP